ncbi:MAG: bifunctional dihydropteridine reductase/dihydrofolate reductase TmpR [Trueperaceae bacterium]
MLSALITGSAKGIGKAILLTLAKNGYDVAVHYRSSLAEAETVAEEAASYGVKTTLLQADVTNAREAQTLVQKTHEAFGRLDVLVNNVGNYHKGLLAELNTENWHNMLDSNLNAVFYTCQTAIPFMRQQGGRIINIGFAGAENLVARPRTVAYVIAKTGVLLYSKALAKSEAAHNITVNVVSPGVIENSVSQPLEDIPMQRTGTFDELTSAVMYFLSPEARYVTGTNIQVAGGWNL